MTVGTWTTGYREQRRQLAAALVERTRRQGQRMGQQEGLDLLTWTVVRRPLLKPGGLFDLPGHRYLVGPYRETAREVVVKKAGQVGASEWLISYALHAADVRGATVLYVFPTDTHVSDFSAARIGPAIEASPYLDGIVLEGGAAGGKRGADRVTLKRVRDRFVYLRGAKVSPDGKAPQLKAIDADVLILDEVDEMDPRAPAIAVKRLGHSLIGEERWVSTPSYPGVGIDAKWQECDQREWFVKCGHCGEWQALTIDQVVDEWDDLGRPVAWHNYIACVKCKQEVERLGPGDWVATYPSQRIVGYHLTKLFSRVVDLETIVQALNTTDETERREAYNQDLGLPYAPRGGRLTDEALDAARREYGHGPKRTDGSESTDGSTDGSMDAEATVMGVDVGRVLHAVVRGPQDEETGERPQRFAGEVESFEELGRLMGIYNVERCVIDALPETRKARELQGEFSRGRVWLAYYVTQKIGTKRAKPVQWTSTDGVVNLDRTRTLDLMLARLLSGECTLPADAREILGYYAHLKAVVRVLEDGPGGQKVARYLSPGPDHLAHAENYCAVASMGPVVWDGLGFA